MITMKILFFHDYSKLHKLHIAPPWSTSDDVKIPKMDEPLIMSN